MKEYREIYVIKADGEKELFLQSKLERSLKKTGTSKKLIKEIVDHVNAEIEDGMTTSEIYKHAFSLLRKSEEKTVAARYSIRRGVFALGPSGFPFENYVAEIFTALGYNTRIQQVIQGKCATHEVDLVAEKDNHRISAEIKFHNRLGIKTDLKVVLYVHARFLDIHEQENFGEGDMVREAWLITNTKFTKSSISYAKCVDLKLLSWFYPNKRGLYDLITQTRVYPITCLSTLSDREKKNLLDQKIVLCRDLGEDTDALQRAGVAPAKIATVIAESQALCTGDHRIE